MLRPPPQKNPSGSASGGKSSKTKPRSIPAKKKPVSKQVNQEATKATQSTKVSNPHQASETGMPGKNAFKPGQKSQDGQAGARSMQGTNPSAPKGKEKARRKQTTPQPTVNPSASAVNSKASSAVYVNTSAAVNSKAKAKGVAVQKKIPEEGCRSEIRGFRRQFGGP